MPITAASQDDKLQDCTLGPNIQNYVSIPASRGADVRVRIGGSMRGYKELFARLAIAIAAAQAGGSRIFMHSCTRLERSLLPPSVRQVVRHTAVSRPGCRSTGSLTVDPW